jgi:hypothetical protein
VIVDGFEIHKMPDGKLFVDDSGYIGHKQVQEVADKIGCDDGAFWEKFWPRWCDKREKAVDKAIGKWAEHG